MDIRQTGIRNREILIASESGKQCKGTIMMLRGKDLIYPPSKAYINKLSSLELRETLSTYSHFTEMTSEQRLVYLKKIAVDNKELHICDLKDVDVKFLSIGFYTSSGSKYTPSFDEETKQRLLSGNPDDDEGFWPLSYVYGLFPKKTTSGKRHTLIFRPSNWTLAQNESEDEFEYSGLVVDPRTGESRKTSVKSKKRELYLFNEEFACHIKREKEIRREELISLILSLTQTRKEQLELFFSRLALHSAFFLQSLIEKIMRFRPKTVEGLNAGACLLASFVSLYLRENGAERGKLLATKTLAMSIIEDGYLPTFEPLQSLLMVALLTKESVIYNPARETFLLWFKSALAALASRRCFFYDCESDLIESQCSVLHKLLCCLDASRPDINMASSIVGYGKDVENLPEFDMCLSHAVDHRCYPEVAWFVEGTVEDYKTLFGELWECSSSVNPRKSQSKVVIERFERAQALVIEAKEVEPQLREIVKGYYYFRLPESYLEECLRQIEGLSREKMTSGVVVKDDLVKRITLRDGQYLIGRELIPWEQFRETKFSLCLHSPCAKTLENTVRLRGEGVEVNADEELFSLRTSEEVLHRLLSYAERAKNYISPCKILENGGRVSEESSPLDSEIYQVLAKISLLYPAALEHNSSFGFAIKHRSLFSHVIEMLKSPR